MKAVKEVDSLPLDILGEIFRYSRGYLLGVYNVQNIICAVCRQWRHAALAHPTLWSYLVLDTGSTYPSIPMLNLWLERSANTALDIHFTANGHVLSYRDEDAAWASLITPTRNPSEEARYAGDSLKALTAHIHRWKKLIVAWAWIGSLFRFLLVDTPFGKAVQLRELGLNPYAIGGSDELLLTSVAQAPNLETFRYTFSLPSKVSGDISFPWHRLKHLFLRNIEIRVVDTILLQCTSAVILQIRANIVDHMARQPRTTISLPALRALDLISITNAPYLLQGLDCPNLEILYIDYNEAHNENPDSDCFEHLLSFLQSSNHSLRVLYISIYPKVLAQSVRRLFTKNPRMTELIALKIRTTIRGGISDAYTSIKSLYEDAGYAIADYLSLSADKLSVGWVLEETLHQFLDERDYTKHLEGEMKEYLGVGE